VSNRLSRIAQAYRAAGIRSIVLGLALLAAAAAAAAPRICALVPHFKDEYWLSVGYGLEREAARAGAILTLSEAGGYNARDAQIAQIALCLAQGADAILIGAVSADHPDLLAAIERAARSVPVVGLVNELRSPALAGRVGVDWRDMGRAVGRYLAARHPAGSAPRTAVLVSGPAASGWAGPLEAGLREALAESSVALVGSYGADTGLRQQLEQVERALAAHPGVEYLIGSAPAIEAAVGLLASRPEPGGPALVASYLNHSVKRGLMNGRILAAPFDDPAAQGEMALRLAVALLAGQPAPAAAGPRIVLLTRGDPGLAAIPVSPAGYFPTIR
jgi:protein TorT